MNTHIFGEFYRQNIKIKLSVHFKFRGGIEGVMKYHFDKVSTSRPDDYGNRPNRGVFDPDGETKLRSSVCSGVLNSEDPCTLQKLFLQLINHQTSNLSSKYSM